MIKRAYSAWTLKKAIVNLKGSLSTDYKYLHASQIPHNKAFHSKPYLTVSDI